jgi:hypothetical protein
MPSRPGLIVERADAPGRHVAGLDAELDLAQLVSHRVLLRIGRIPGVVSGTVQRVVRPEAEERPAGVHGLVEDAHNRLVLEVAERLPEL